MEQKPTFEQINELRKALAQSSYKYWLNDTLLTIDWWILIAMLIVPWLIWKKLVDRSKLYELVVYGLFVTLIVTLFDVMGFELMLWEYPVQLAPLLPRALAYDIGLFPVIYMLIYQYFNQWKSFVIVTIIMAVLFAYGGEPIAEWIGLYKPIHWHHWYSMIIYILIGLFFRWLTKKIMKISGVDGESSSSS